MMMITFFFFCPVNSVISNNEFSNFYSRLPPSAGEDWGRAEWCLMAADKPWHGLWVKGLVLVLCFFFFFFFAMAASVQSDTASDVSKLEMRNSKHNNFTGLLVRIFHGIFHCSGRPQLWNTGVTSCYSSWGWSFSPARSHARQSFQVSADTGAMPSLIFSYWKMVQGRVENYHLIIVCNWAVCKLPISDRAVTPSIPHPMGWCPWLCFAWWHKAHWCYPCLWNTAAILSLVCITHLCLPLPRKW